MVFDVGGQTFAAHRCVLAARSPAFSAELFGAMKESNTAGVIHVDDMEAQVFKALLYFVYTDSLPKTKNTEEEDEEEDVMSQHLLVAADRYNLERLKLLCEEKLCKYIDVGTVATILALAEQHNCHGLKKACFDFLSSPTNLRAVVVTDGFKHLKRSCPAIMDELILILHYGRLLLCRVPKHTAEHYMHTEKGLPCAAHGKEHTAFRRRQRCRLPCAIYRAHDKAFAVCQS